MQRRKQTNSYVNKRTRNPVTLIFGTVVKTSLKGGSPQIV